MKKIIIYLSLLATLLVSSEYIYIEKNLNVSNFIAPIAEEIPDPYPSWNGESHATPNSDFVGPHTYIGDIFFDGTNLITSRYYCGVSCGGTVQILDGISNTVVSQFESGSGTSIYGIAVVNGDIITGDESTKLLRIHDGYTDVVKETTVLPMIPSGITYNGTDLIITDRNGSVYIMDGVSNTIKETLPISGMNGITFDGTNLWGSNKNGIYKFNGYTGEILETITPGNTNTAIGKKIIWDGSKIVEASVGSINGGPWRIYVH